MSGRGIVASSIRKDRCVRFAGNTGASYVNMGTGGPFNFERTDSFSVYHWARWTQASVGILASRCGELNAGKGWVTHTRPDGAFAFTLKNANSPNALGMITTAGGFNDNKWHSLVSTYAGTSVPSGCHLYVDNADQALTIGSNTLTGTTVGSFDLNFGADVPPSPFPYTGDFAGVAIFSGVIDATARAVLHNNRKGPPRVADVLALSGLLGFWRMGDGDAYPTVADETGAHDGTIVGLSAAAMASYAPPYS